MNQRTDAARHAAACLLYASARRALSTPAHFDDEPRRDSPLPAATARDRREAALVRRALLEPEPLPPDERLLREVRNRLRRRPHTRHSLMRDLRLRATTPGVSEDLTEVLSILIQRKECKVLGYRHKNGNAIAVYGVEGQRIPFEPLLPGDAEGAVAQVVAQHDGTAPRYLLAHLRATLDEKVGPQTVKTALNWLVTSGQVENRGGIYYAM